MGLVHRAARLARGGLESLLAGTKGSRPQDAAGGWLTLFRTPRRRAKAASAWPAWRQRAIDHLAIEHPKAKMAASTLVEIFLFEGLPLDALREARRRPIWPRQWLLLAGGLAAGHPREALAIFEEKVVPLFTSTPSRQRLADIVKVLRALQRGASEAGLGEGFKALVAKMRRDFGRKQWLIEALAKEGWSGGEA